MACASRENGLLKMAATGTMDMRPNTLHDTNASVVLQQLDLALSGLNALLSGLKPVTRAAFSAQCRLFEAVFFALQKEVSTDRALASMSGTLVLLQSNAALCHHELELGGIEQLFV